MVHVLQLACPEGFGFSYWSHGPQIEKGIAGRGVCHPGGLHCMYSALSKCPQGSLELFWQEMVQIKTITHK